MKRINKEKQYPNKKLIRKKNSKRIANTDKKATETDNNAVDVNLKSEQELIDENDEAFKKINCIFSPKIVYKPLKEKKLTIILIENNLNNMLKKLIQNSVTSGLICIISYGETVQKSEIIDFSNFDTIDFKEDNNLNNRTCLFDALIELNKVIFTNYMKIEEKEKEKIQINNIEVIGIGTCKDNCSKVTKETAICSFNEIINELKLVTKYFCLTEESFLEAAEIGFRSIGAIIRNYQ